MKKVHNSFIVLCLIISNFHLGAAQTTLRLVDCNALEVSFFSPANKEVVEREFLLEKELIVGVWQKIKERKEKKAVVLFNDLSGGIYRVSVVTRTVNVKRTKIHTKGKDGNLLESNVFISNKVELTDEIEPCDEISNNRISRPQGSVYQERFRQFELFPNPANTNLNIRLSKKENINNAKITIQDINGQELVKQTLFSASQELSIAHLEEGVYFVKIEIEGALAVFKKILVMR